MSFLDRLFSHRHAASDEPLYAAIVAVAREPHWYVEGGVPDTIDGRFEMLTAILSLVLARLEGDESARGPSVVLAERFIADMDGQLRQIGIGDLMVGKHVGKLMGALGGRIGAYRAGLAPGGDFAAALARNLYRGDPPAAPVPAHTEARLRGLADAFASMTTEALLGGALPKA